MSVSFPTIVYRCPGPHWGPPGTTYQSVGVDNAEQFAAKLADGWYETLVEAAAAFLNPPAPPAPEPVAEAVVGEVVDPVPVDNAPPTRDEMVAQAALLGLKVDKRWSDETLLAKVNAAVAADPVPADPPPVDPAPNDDPI